MKKNRNQHRGFTLIEAVVVIGVLGVVIMSVLTMFNNSVRNSAAVRARLVAVTLATQEMEKIRNIEYDKVCTQGGCSIQSSQQFLKNGINYTVAITVNYVDDLFDGCGTDNDDLACGGKPRDDSPNDYKKVQITVAWDKFYNNTPVLLSTIVVPKGMEIAPSTGALSIKVFNAKGEGVPQATVDVSSEIQGYSKTNTTDDNGNLQILDLPPADDYHIEVSKLDENFKYSSDQTYEQTDTFIPINPDKTVVASQVTEASFSIDLVSTLTVATLKTDCTDANQGNSKVNLKLQGEKIIGYDINGAVPKETRILFTMEDTTAKAEDLEWDNYTLTVTGTTLDTSTGDVNGDGQVGYSDVDYLINYLYKGGSPPVPLSRGDVNKDGKIDASDVIALVHLIEAIPTDYDLAGVIMPSSLNILPDAHKEVTLVLEEHTQNSLLVTVKDSGTGSTVGDASVSLSATSPSYNQTKITNKGVFEQTNWSGGSDQELFSDQTKYSSDENMDNTSTAGELSLEKDVQKDLTIPLNPANPFFSTPTYKDPATTAEWSTTYPGQVTLRKVVAAVDSNRTIAYQEKSNVENVDSKSSKETFTTAAIAPPPIPEPPHISLNPTALAFSAVQGALNPTAKPLTITNEGSGTLNWSIAKVGKLVFNNRRIQPIVFQESQPVKETYQMALAKLPPYEPIPPEFPDCPWLNVGPPTAGNSNFATITVQPNDTNLIPKIYACDLIVSSTNADNSPQKVSVTYTVTAPAPHISLTPTSLSFTAVKGAALPSSQPLTIKNTGGGTLNWSVTDSCSVSDWLNENPMSGTTGAGSNSSVNVQPNTTNLAPGTYSCTITVSSTNADNSPQTVSVNYYITEPAPSYQTSGFVLTKKLNDTTGTVIKAKLSVSDNKPDSTDIKYYLSTNGGSSWVEVNALNSWTISSTSGTDLRFKADLSTTVTSITPTIYDIDITYNLETYRSSGYLISSIFKAGIGSKFSSLSWDPSSQVPATGEVKFQIATSNDLNPAGGWKYYGHDYTQGTYYTISGTDINNEHNDDLYLRYKLYLSTADNSFTPTVSYISIDYALGCTPPGQVFFKDLSTANYTLNVTKDDYYTYSTTIENLSGYNQREVNLRPNPP